MEESQNLKDESYDLYEEDLMAKMRNKIRAQANRLRLLEQYKIICEKRLTEMGQVLPVRPEDLGTGSILDVLEAEKQRISELENSLENSLRNLEESQKKNLEQAERINTLAKEKNKAEEKAKLELTKTEEQKTYIEALKQALETSKAAQEKLILDRRASPLSDKGQEKALKSTIAEHENQQKRLKTQIKEKDQTIAHLKKDLKEMEAQMAQAAEALQIAEEEVDKLEEEKISLIEYVDNNSVKEAKLEDQLKEIKRKMAKESEEAFQKLREEGRKKTELEAKNEGLQEEVFKGLQVVKDLQVSLKDNKALLEDQKGLVKTLKEEKLALEIKIEGLEATCKELHVALDEYQIISEKLKLEFESKNRSETENFDELARSKEELRNLAAEKKELVKRLTEIESCSVERQKTFEEIEKRCQKIIEDMQDCQENLGKYKEKYENLEEKQRQQVDINKNYLVSEEKLSQLQTDYSYLQDIFKDTQKRELEQIETINKLTQANTDLLNDLESLFAENETLHKTLSNTLREKETLLKEISSAKQICSTLENRKKLLESSLIDEKNSCKSSQEQNSIDRSKLADFSSQIKELVGKQENFVVKIKELENEVVLLKEKLRAKQRESEEDKLKILKLGEETQALNCRVQECQNDYDLLQIDIVLCCKAVAAFAGKYTVPANDHRIYISQGYKEFLQAWKENITKTPKLLHSWIQSSIEELENLAKLLSNTQKTISTQASDIQKLSSKLEKVNTQDLSAKEETLKLQTKLEESSKSCSKILESSEQEIKTLKLDLLKGKKQVTVLTQDLSNLKLQLTELEDENYELKLSLEKEKTLARGLEERVNLVRAEKTQLEGLLAQKKRTVSVNEVAKEAVRRFEKRGDLENQSDFLAKQRAAKCEKMIQEYRKGGRGLESEASREELRQTLRRESKIDDVSKSHIS